MSKQYSLKNLPDLFIPGLFLMMLIAYVFPGIGMKGEYLNLDLIIDAGISLIFFFYGLKMSPEKFRAGVSNWKLHITIQSITFIVFPILVLPFYSLTAGSNYETIWMAVFFLAALPSTVSSSVVMVSIARGNVPGAIFNASISGIIGIFATPLWMSLFLDAHAESFVFIDVLLQLIVQILLPVFVGLMLNRMMGSWAERYKKQLNHFDKIIILLIVYKSFSNSFESGIITSLGLAPLLALSACVILLFFIVIVISNGLSRLMNFSREDRITAVFCGTKKSLVHGSVMYSVLFSGMAAGGIFLLPIMIYHAFQLFYISIIAKKSISLLEKNRNTLG